MGLHHRPLSELKDPELTRTDNRPLARAFSWSIQWPCGSLPDLSGNE